MAENGEVGEVPAVEMEEKKRSAPDELDVSELPEAKKAKVEEVDLGGEALEMDEYVMEGLTLYDMHRKARDTTTETTKTVSFSNLAPELTCYLCEGPFLRTYTVMECLHRFCFDCVSKYLRIGRKDCPRCGVKLPSTRFMRPDHGVDLLLSFICPSSHRPSKSLCQENLERRIPLIAERHANGPLSKIDELDPFFVPDPSTSPSGSRTPGTPSKKRQTPGKSSANTNTKRGRPSKAQKLESAKEPVHSPSPPPPAPIIHTAPAVIKMAAPLPLKSTANLPTNPPFSSTPPPAPQSTPNATSTSSLPLKTDLPTKTEGSGVTEPHPTPTSTNSAETPSLTPSVAATASISNPTQKAASTSSQSSNNPAIPQPKKQRRPVGEQILVTLMPKPDAKLTIGALHKPFIIAPTSASVDHLSQLINATLKVDTPLEVGWRISPNSDGTEPLDKNVTLDWINKHYFIPHHKDILLYFSKD